MKRQIGVSVASLLPWSLGKDGFRRSINIAIKAGFDGIQILPLRGWEFCDHNNDPYGDKTNLDALGISGFQSELVISFEDAWNSGSFVDAIQREIVQLITRKCTWEHKPLFLDWFLFGSQEESERAVKGFIKFFPSALYISNGWPKYGKRDYGAVELCPEMFPERCTLIPESIVWDTEHILRKGRHGEPPIALTTNSPHSNWRELLEKIDAKQIKLIHVKPGFPTELEFDKMLNALTKKTRDTLCPVIWEGKPIFGSQQKTVDHLKKCREFLEKRFDWLP